MYKKIMTLIFALVVLANLGFSQDMVKNITLEQTKGEFSVQELTLSPGTYQFEIVNNNVGSDVGFVLAPKSNPDQHIEEAYVTELVKNNTAQKSKTVNLSPGEYIYFCPLNKTPQYSLIVE